ncbi:uncharacterized protein LOC127706993 [Mytilus californianus]|uniref:uncharacterized protein LOC127706993 n=1 Tax=Mytilus californianus TaxID=6549 RepID=UPI0022464DD4|nr:uncharacterized protein LOC127706993 [Mytilus californianus]
MRTFIQAILPIILYLQVFIVTAGARLVGYGGPCNYHKCVPHLVCPIGTACFCPDPIANYFDRREQICKPKDFVDIAKRKPTSMSSPPPSLYRNMKSYHANNGIYWEPVIRCADPDPNGPKPQWWKVNLQAYYEVHRLFIFTGESLDRFDRFAVDVIAGSKEFRCEYSRGDPHSYMSYYREVNCASNTVGKELKIASTIFHSLCEVDVNGTLANPSEFCSIGIQLNI